MWSVSHNGKVYDVYCKKFNRKINHYGVYLVREGEKIYLGETLKDTRASTTNWWAFGDPRMMRNIEGFATRRYAIEYMLREQGYYEKI